jgi:putative phosphoribosyl transferase
MIFIDRTDAGKNLARALRSYQGQDVVIYALPRGGVILGAEIARELDAPLDVIVVRKIGHPLSPEYAIAAIAEDGHTATNPSELASIDTEWFEGRSEDERQEARRRRELYTRGRAAISATDRIAIIVDDGLATGLTMFAAIQEIRHARPKKVVVAVPVAPPNVLQQLKKVVDEVIALHITPVLGAIGAFYLNFDQVTDDQVIELMKAVPASQPHG